MMTPSLARGPSGERMPDREWVQSDRRAENSRIHKEEDELRLNSWIQLWSTGRSEIEWISSMLLARKPSVFHWRTLSESGGRVSRGHRKQLGTCGDGESAEGGRKVKGLKARVGLERCISRGGRWSRLKSEGVRAGGVRRGRHSVCRCVISRKNRDSVERTAPGVKASENFESKKRE